MSDPSRITNRELELVLRMVEQGRQQLERQIREGFAETDHWLKELNGKAANNAKAIAVLEEQAEEALTREHAVEERVSHVDEVVLGIQMRGCAIGARIHGEEPEPRARGGLMTAFLRWWPVIALALTWAAMSLSAFYSMKGEVAQIRAEATHAGVTAKAAIVAHENQQAVTAAEQARRLEAIEQAVTDLRKTWEGRK